MKPRGRLGYLFQDIWQLRSVVAIAAVLLTALAAYVWFVATQPERLRPFGTEKLGEDVICNRYGDAVVCQPAPQAVQEARAARSERLDGSTR
jgi:hypothetical protein